MPYSISDQSNLPDHVKKLSAAKRRQWIHVWNSEHGKDKDERKAFAMANAAVKKELSSEGLVAHEKGYIYGYDVEARQVSQDEANYRAYGATGTRGCASCRFYISPNSCILVRGDISPTGISNYYAAPVPFVPEPIAVRVVKEAASDDGVETSPGPLSKMMTVLQDFVRKSKEVLVGGSSKALTSFWIEKDIDGRYRAFAIYSNVFKDKHKQIISEAAHKEYISWLDSDAGVYPEFHLWHAGPLSRFGQVDFVDYLDGFTVASGLVDTDKEYIAEALQEQELRVSHGFFGLADGADIYRLYRSFEISPLPVGAESNAWTAFDLAFKENLMPFTDAKKKWLKEVAKVDDAKIAEMEATTKQLGDNLKQLGIEYKEEGVVSATAETATAGGATTEAVAAAQGVDFTQLVGTMESVQKSMAAIAGAVATIGQQVTTVTKEFADYKAAESKTVEDKAGDLNLARVATAAGAGGHVASAAPGNVVSKEAGDAVAAKAAEDEDWFTKVAMRPFVEGGVVVNNGAS